MVEEPGGIATLYREGRSRFEQLIKGKGTAGTLTRGALWSFFITLMATAVGFGLQLTLTRVLGDHEYGLYVIALGWVNTFLLLGKFDLDTAGIRFIGGYAGGDQWGLVRGYIRRVGAIVAVASVGLAAVLMVSTVIFRSMVPADRYLLFLAAGLVLPLAAALRFLSGVAQGLTRVVLAQLPERIMRPMGTGILVAVGVLVFGLSPRAHVAMVLSVGSSLVAALAGFYWLFRHLPSEYKKAAPQHETRLWLRTARGLFALSAMQLILGAQTDIIIVGVLLEPVEAGRYAIANMLANFGRIGFSAVLFVGTPLIAEYHHNRKPEDLQRLVTAVSRVNTLVTVPILLGLVVLGKPVLGLFGSSYAAAYPILMINAANVLQGAVAGSIAGFVLSMTGREVQGAWIMGASSVLYLSLVIPLTARFGAVGTATATLIAFTFRAIILHVYILRNLKLNVLPWGRAAASA